MAFFDEGAPKIQVTFTIAPEMAQYLTNLYTLIEGDTEEPFYWGTNGPTMLNAWHFAGDQLIDKCSDVDTWVAIRDSLDKLTAQWELSNKRWKEHNPDLPT